MAITVVISISLALGWRTSAHRPGMPCSITATSAARRSSRSATARARPLTTTLRKFIEWPNAERASTRPSTWVTVMQTPSSAAARLRLVAAPWR